MVNTSFQVAGGVIVAEVVRLTNDEIYEIGNKIRKLVNAEHAKFFKILARKGIDVPQAPNLGPYTPSWSILTNNPSKGGRFPGYVDWKKKHGFSSNFYKKTGELQTTLMSLNPTAVLGSPDFKIRGAHQIGRAGVKGLTLQRISSRGRAFTQFLGRDTLGRFAKLSDVARRSFASLSVLPLPRFSDGGRNAEERLFRGTDPLTYYKFVNPAEQKKRPLLSNFIDWWINVHIPRVVERAL